MERKASQAVPFTILVLVYQAACIFSLQYSLESPCDAVPMSCGLWQDSPRLSVPYLLEQTCTRAVEDALTAHAASW